MSRVYSLVLATLCLALTASSAPPRDDKWNIMLRVPLKELNNTSPWSSGRETGFTINGIFVDWMVEVMLQENNETIAYKSYFYESKPDPYFKPRLTARGELTLKNNYNGDTKPDGSKYEHIVQNYKDIVNRDEPGTKFYQFINKTLASQEAYQWLKSGNLYFHQTVAYFN